MADKVRFNLLNVYYAVLQDNTSVIPVYSMPVAIPGAVSVYLERKGKPEVLKTDGNTYFVIDESSFYEGDLEIAIIPESFRTDVLNEITDNNGVLIEKDETESKSFALLFQFDGDESDIRYILYNCSVSKPEISGNSNTLRKRPHTEKLHIAAVPLRNGLVKAKTGNLVSQAVLNAWYSSVYLPVTTFSLLPETLTLAPGDFSLIKVNNPIGDISVNVTGESLNSLDILYIVDRKSVLIDVDENAEPGTYRIEFTDLGRTEENTAVLTLNVSSP